MLLRLREELTEKEIKKFNIPNTLSLDNFCGVQYAMCIAGIIKKGKKYEYYPPYSMTYVNTDITPNKVISFCELHKGIVHKEKVFGELGRVITKYYIVYSAEQKPTLYNNFAKFANNNIDVEITFNDNDYYRVQDVHLALSNNTSVIASINALFSEENIEYLPFVKKLDDDWYEIVLYDFYGLEKKFKYHTIQHIYNLITNIRLIGCKEIYI